MPRDLVRTVLVAFFEGDRTPMTLEQIGATAMRIALAAQREEEQDGMRRAAERAAAKGDGDELAMVSGDRVMVSGGLTRVEVLETINEAAAKRAAREQEAAEKQAAEVRERIAASEARMSAWFEQNLK